MRQKHFVTKRSFLARALAAVWVAACLGVMCPAAFATDGASLLEEVSQGIEDAPDPVPDPGREVVDAETAERESVEVGDAGQGSAEQDPANSASVEPQAADDASDSELDSIDANVPAQEAVDQEDAGLTAQTQIPMVTYGVHRQTYGDQEDVADGDVAGTIGESKRLEALWISVGKTNLAGGIRYRVHVQGIGWRDWVTNGARAGTTGESRRLEALQVELTGELAKRYRVYYRVHAQRAGWMGWATDGAVAGTEGMSWRLEAVQVVLVPVGDAPPDDVAGIPSATEHASLAHSGVRYSVHVQTYGWRGWASDGSTAGTVGESKRLEGLKASLGSTSLGGGLRYRTHVQTYGWRDWSADGAVSGTTGESKRLEAMCMEVTGEAARYFDVWYRVHAQTYGWLGWAKNGENAGTEGRSKRLEAVEVRLVPKGAPAPGGTAGAFLGEPRQMIFVGDSRAAGMYETLYGEVGTDPVVVEKVDAHGDWWIMRSKVGYGWLEIAGAERAGRRVTGNSSVVIWLGINDIIGIKEYTEDLLQYSDTAHYAALINAKAAEWTSRGARVYLATVGPVGRRTGDDVFRSAVYPAYGTTNAAVEEWNRDLASRLSPSITVLDVYGAVRGNYSSWDGLHYDKETYVRCYEFIRNAVI